MNRSNSILKFRKKSDLYIIRVEITSVEWTRRDTVAVTPHDYTAQICWTTLVYSGHKYCNKPTCPQTVLISQ